MRKLRIGSLRLVGVKASQFDGANICDAADQMRMDRVLGCAEAGEGEVVDVASTYLCVECGKNVSLSERAEHDDWHLALQLQRGQVGVLGKRGAGDAALRVGGKKKVRDPKQKSLLAMFAPK